MQRLLIALLFCLYSLTVSAKELQEHFAGLNTWQADFVQTIKNKDTDAATKSEGKLWLLRPNRFRLEYIKPFKQVYVADGSKLWFYDEDLEQVTVKPQKGLLDQTPAMILSQPQKLSATYNIKSNTEGPRTRYFLYPKSAESGFEHIEILFEGSQLIQMHMYDHFAQKTSLLFSNIQNNPSVEKQRFQFTPPANVDVIGEE